MKGIIRKNQ